MSQTRLGSAVEALTNTGIGFVVAICGQLFITWLYDIHTTLQQDLLITIFFTGLSILRGYWVRRFFNWIAHR